MLEYWYRYLRIVLLYPLSILLPSYHQLFFSFFALHHHHVLLHFCVSPFYIKWFRKIKNEIISKLNIIFNNLLNQVQFFNFDVIWYEYLYILYFKFVKHFLIRPFMPQCIVVLLFLFSKKPLSIQFNTRTLLTLKFHK